MKENPIAEPNLQFGPEIPNVCRKNTFKDSGTTILNLWGAPPKSPHINNLVPHLQRTRHLVGQPLGTWNVQLISEAILGQPPNTVLAAAANKLSFGAPNVV